MGKAIDLTGQQFGRLTVLNKTEKRSGHNIVWHCQCICGNEIDVSSQSLRQGKTKSCGCLKKEKASEIGKKYKNNLIFAEIIDLSKNKYDRLQPLEYCKEIKKWKCKCDCGNITYVRTSDLESGNTKSCGCIRKEITSQQGKSMKEDLTGQQFGRLTVLKDTGERINHQPMWLCKCMCGSLHKVAANNLKSGNVQSCGCLISKGEEKISKILSEANIYFEKQKSFDTCIFPTGKKAKFDFYVNNNYIIEYDGIQHFEYDQGWNTFNKFKETQEKDIFKNNWCKENNIPLIRIPYTKLNTLELNDLLLTTSKFIKG